MGKSVNAERTRRKFRLPLRFELHQFALVISDSRVDVNLKCDWILWWSQCVGNALLDETDCCQLCYNTVSGDDSNCQIGSDLPKQSEDAGDCIFYRK
jgi:hypothetical protein